ncbi:hypothetical protein ACH42_05540 [Endozoicomonas sp. (ex Bugula neritina AB1)]|nr:hypothetical protein ACH42_05540 [Endozoicomonas sp. (ex Bugula neritina AB1)]
MEQPSPSKTIAIIGGGPAGSATALSLMNALKHSARESDFSVHIFNAPSDNGIQVGESIPPAAISVLGQLGVKDIVDTGEHLVCPGSISLWNSDTPGHNDFLLDVVGRAYHLDRTIFESQMLSSAEMSGAKVHRNWRLTAVKQSGSAPMELQFSVQRQRVERLSADFVVDASGKSSVFARRLEVARNVFDEVLFLCAVIDIPAGLDILPHTFVEAVELGWWYAARIPGNKMITTFCIDAETMKKEQLNIPCYWLEQLRKTQWISKHIPSAVIAPSGPEPEILIRTAPSSILSAVCGKEWLAVGDAASSYDPITSAGITKALMQGNQAGAAISSLILDKKTEAMERYQLRVFDDFNQYIGVRSQLYRSERRFSHSRFWLRRTGQLLS